MKQAQRSVNYVSTDFVCRRIAALLRGVIVTGGIENHKGDLGELQGKREMSTSAMPNDGFSLA
jgi:hypothetical protein